MNYKILVSLLFVACTGCKQTVPQMTEHHEAVVVGSGYGGAVAALRLGEAGIQTLVLEKGRRWTVTDTTGKHNVFATLGSVMSILSPDGRSAWLSDLCMGNFFNWILCSPTTGIVEITDSYPNPRDHSPLFAAHHTRIMAGVGVGGGSLVNNAETFPPTRRMWELAYDLEAMPYLDQVWHELDSIYFDRAMAMLQPQIIPDDILQTDYFAFARQHIDAMSRAGYPMTDDPEATHASSHTPMIIDWDAVQEEIEGKRVASVIDGEVWLGTNSGAKKSLDRDYSYLGLAEKTGHVEIRPLHTVQSIAFDESSGLYRIKVMQTNLRYKALAEWTFTTPNLIMAAGSIGTTKLLVAAKHQNGLPALNEHVGTKWVNNGNSATFRDLDMPPRTRGIGGPASIKTFDFDDPSAPVNIQMLPMKIPALAQQFGFGLFTIALGVPQGEGHFSYDEASQTVHLHWPADGSKNVYDRFLAIMQQVDEYGRHIPLPQTVGQGVTLHPLGGVPLGLATDEQCRVKGYDGLYAVDGAIIPGASLANPSLLIAAMAERCMVSAVQDILARRDQGTSE